MPASYLMSWEPKSRRWWKQHKGKRHVVSCRQLGAPETKEGSYQLANEWWRARQAAIDGETELLDGRHVHRSVIDMLEFRGDWCLANGRPEDAVVWSRRIEDVRAMQTEANPYTAIVSPVVAERLDYLQRAGGSIPPEMEPEDLEFQVGEGQVWYQREREARTVLVEKSISGLSQRFLKLSESRMNSGGLSASELDTARRCVGHAVDFFGAGNEPSVITPERWEDFWHHLLRQVAEGKQSKEYVRKDWRYGKSFIRWMASMGKMTLPANLEERRYKFGGGATAIKTFEVEEVQKLVKAAPGQTKLHLLLMLNCGMYQGDISDLRHEEVDWNNGVITRQRSKTRHHGAKTPTVRYRLWPVTFALLKEYRSDHPELVLTTRGGKPWVEAEMKGTRFTRRDGIKSNFAHLQRRLKIDKPLKLFRKTSATLLDKHKEYGRYAQFFLGHAGRSIAERHYVVPDQDQFDNAVDWLRQKYEL